MRDLLFQNTKIVNVFACLRGDDHEGNGRR